MFDILRNKFVIFLIVITLGIVSAVVVVNRTRSTADGATNVFGTVISPLQRGVTAVMDGVSNFFGNFVSKKQLQQENEALSKELADTKGKIVDYDILKNDNEHLKNMLDYKDATQQFQFVAAPVIATDNPGLFKGFTINAGTKDGLLNKMPVVNEKGLIGYTSQVGSNFTKVVSILDSSTSVGAMVVRTGDIAIVEGDLELSDKGLCKMSYIPNSATLLPGDSVVTSGLGGVYPKGLLIGTIKEIHPDVESVSKYAIIEPVVDFEKIYDVLVMKGF